MLHNLKDTVLGNAKNNHQIVQEYFEKLKEGGLSPCIYEEKENTEDREWFFYNDNWCYFEIKKKRDIELKEYFDFVLLKKKRIKTFPKNKCSVQIMSFENFMYLSYCQLKETEEFFKDEVELYIDNFFKLKEKDDTFNVKKYNEYLIEKEIQEKKEANEALTGCFLWTLTIILALTGVGLPLAILVCPLTWKFINNSKKKKDDVN